jgi:hypothetical protein
LAALVRRDLHQPVKLARGEVGEFTVYVDEQSLELQFLDLFFIDRIINKIKEALATDS